jgi:hypothetical protein
MKSDDRCSIDRVRRDARHGPGKPKLWHTSVRFNFDLSLSPAKEPRITYARA